MASGISGAGIFDISKRIFPYVLALIAVWLAVAIFPELSLGILANI